MPNRASWASVVPCQLNFSAASPAFQRRNDRMTLMKPLLRWRSPAGRKARLSVLIFHRVSPDLGQA